MFTKPDEVTRFVTAGNAVVTLESKKTGKHITYKVRQAKSDKGEPQNRWFVGVLTGPDNINDYTYLGILEQKYEAPHPMFRQTAKSKVGADAPSVRGFNYMWNNVCKDKLPGDLIVRHEGRCGRCHRPLTVPESIDTGLGPFCRDQLGS